MKKKLDESVVLEYTSDEARVATVINYKKCNIKKANEIITSIKEAVECGKFDTSIIVPHSIDREYITPLLEDMGYVVKFGNDEYAFNRLYMMISWYPPEKESTK
jgi:hypothetical protein